MGEENDLDPPAPSVDQGIEIPVEFLGREIYVRRPSPEQVLVWQRVLRRLQDPDLDNWTGAQLLNELEKVRKIIDSLLANESDIDWLDGEMLAGRVDLISCMRLVENATVAIHETTAKSSTPKKRATRRKS
jgi:hypothetical protein